MNKLSLKMKLKLGFGVLLAMLIAMGVVSYFSMRKLTELSDTVDLRGEKQLLAADIRSSLDSEKVYLRGFLLTGSESERNRFQENATRLTDTMGALEQLLTTEEDRRLFGKMQQATEQYNSVLQRVYDLRSAGKTREAVDLLFGAEATAARDGADQSVPDFMDYQGRINTADRTQQAVSGARSMVWIVGLAVGGLLFGIPLATLIGRSVAGSVSRMVARIQEVAANNLAVEDMSVESEDELGTAAMALNSMKNNLSTIMQSIAGTAEHVASASEEIAAGAAQMATGGETQKDQVHQVATAMQEMSATVHEVSENCNRAADSARQTVETARQGGAIVEDTLAHMRSVAVSVRETAQKVQELGSRSDQIGKIVGVIDDIADQTNLLALNAAIEAARAGEQGRGFAVVADEVRKLAERTTKATKEIAEMIQSVQVETRGAVEKMQSGTQQVEKGVEVTAKAGESLKQIIGQAEHVGEMVTHIATAANQQSSATEQVNNNMDQINKLVAESADGAQQSAQACEQLSGLALELQNLVSSFKL
ncbi:MAG: HAMP domain-containing methyl-accepting chemotaxis protein, partial [Terriglobales bacterium]